MNSSFFLHWYVASYLMLGGATQNCFLQSTRTAPKNPCKLSSHTASISHWTTGQRYNHIRRCSLYFCAGFIWTDVKKYWHVIILFNCLKHIFIISYIQRHTHTHFQDSVHVYVGFMICLPMWENPADILFGSLLTSQDSPSSSQYILLSRKPDACSSVHAHTLKAHQPKRLWIINVNNNQYCMSA